MTSETVNRKTCFSHQHNTHSKKHEKQSMFNVDRNGFWTTIHVGLTLPGRRFLLIYLFNISELLCCTIVKIRWAMHPEITPWLLLVVLMSWLRSDDFCRVLYAVYKRKISNDCGQFEPLHSSLCCRALLLCWTEVNYISCNSIIKGWFKGSCGIRPVYLCVYVWKMHSCKRKKTEWVCMSEYASTML